MSGFLLVGWILGSHFSRADQVLIVSGGGSPTGNHYSQYLQTKTLADNIRSRYPEMNISVFFGAGNASGRPPQVADVHKVTKFNETSVGTMIPGTIEGNLAATPENVNAYFTSSQESAKKKDEHLFLLVSDHGMPNPAAEATASGQDYSNNCIDLWGFVVDEAESQFSMRNGVDRCLSRTQLQGHLLSANARAKRTIFAMSQCFSGGFHQMSVDLSKTYPSADPRICGFTAVTEDTTASGCTPDVDGPNYQGYERFFTEQLTGVDVVSGKALRPPRKSFEEAHRAALLTDLTKDIPLSTSDFYLWKWALAIEKPDFVPRTKTIRAEEARRIVAGTVIGAQPDFSDPAFRTRGELFAETQNQFSRLYPEYASAFTGSMESVRALETELGVRLAKAERTYMDANRVVVHQELELLRRWNAFVENGKSSLAPVDADLEVGFFGYFDRLYGMGASSSVAAYFLSLMAVREPAKADALARYRAQRTQHARTWAGQSAQTDLIRLDRNLSAGDASTEQLADTYVSTEKRQGHVRRILIYRQILGAWRALVHMDDRQALSDLKALLECESTPLP